MGSSRQGTTHSKTDNSGHVQKVKFKAKEYKIHHADARLLHTDAEGKTKEVVRSQVARKSADIIESGKSMLQGKTLTGWEKRYRSWVNGEGLIDEENEPAGV
jgi:hypothetical protein